MEAVKETSREEEAAVYHCPGCGAQIVTDSTTVASFCYYCHNPVVLSGRLPGEYLPDFVIPFSIDRRQAQQRFLEYVGKKKFILRAFCHASQLEKLSSVYFPYWMYDCSLEGKMKAQGTNSRVWKSGDVEYTEMKYYRILREGQVEIKYLTRNALQKKSRKLVQGVFPFDMEKRIPFQMEYLSGYLLEKRDVEQEDLKQELRQETKGYCRELLKDTISGYSGVTVESCDLTLGKENWSYVLLPVWTVTYRAKTGAMYYYSMNGQTGTIYGELPVDDRKAALAGIGVGLLVFFLFLLGGCWKLFFALAAAALAGTVCFSAIVGKYRMKWGACPYSWQKNGSVKLSRKEDSFRNRVVTHRRIPKKCGKEE